MTDVTAQVRHGREYIRRYGTVSVEPEMPSWDYRHPGTTVTELAALGMVDHRRVAAARAVGDLLAALGVPRGEQTPEVCDRIAEAFIELMAARGEVAR